MTGEISVNFTVRWSARRPGASSSRRAAAAPTSAPCAMTRHQEEDPVPDIPVPRQLAVLCSDIAHGENDIELVEETLGQLEHYLHKLQAAHREADDARARGLRREARQLMRQSAGGA